MRRSCPGFAALKSTPLAPAGLTGAALLFSGLISSMRRPLDDLVSASERLAAGDLDARVRVGGLSETAALGTAFNNMAEELQRREGERDQLDRFCRRHGDLLGDKVIVYKQLEHWSVMPRFDR